MSEDKDVIRSWDDKSIEWDIWIGEEGDNNRIYNSDPILWEMLGDVNGKIILDVGCGNGYLAVKMAKAGAKVTGVDVSENMILYANEKARKEKEKKDLGIIFLCDSCSNLETQQDDFFDIVVSNYVLMDVSDVENAIKSFYRVLKKGGVCINIFSHPCFGSSILPERLEDNSVRFTWTSSYFDSLKFKQEWGPFKTEFISFHRPLSFYFKIFKDAGFNVIDFQEPVVDNNSEFDSELIKRFRMTPYSVAFKLEK
ncbi:class I SAM-dependent methyltransferase [Bacteroidota bacterium]